VFSNDHLELQHLLSGLCDDQLSEAEFARLEQTLQDDSLCRRRYLEYMDLHTALIVRTRRGSLVPGAPAAERSVTAGEAGTATWPSGLIGPRFSPARIFRYVAVAAGAVAASFLIQFNAPPPAPPPVTQAPAEAPRSKARTNQPKTDTGVATLRQAVDCVWENPARFQKVGARLPPGEYRLLKGVATIDFDSGSELIVEGPAVLRVESSTVVSLASGKVVFRADDSAAPFALRTPSSTLAELDTEFAVSVSETSEEVHVFEGKVERISNLAANDAKPEELKAGEARRYEGAPAVHSTPMAFDPKRFVRHVAAPASLPIAGLLAYEGFNYRSPTGFSTGKANGGIGWTGPWKAAVTRLPSDANRPPRPVLNPKDSLTRAGASVPAVGGSFEHTGFAKSWRRLAVPIRLDTDGVYYLSYLFQRDNSAPHPIDSAGILFWTDEDYQQKKNEDFWKRLNIGVMKSNTVYTRLQRMKASKSVPMEDGVTYLLVAKIVASQANPDQVFARVYRPDELVESTEPTAWPLHSPPFRSDLVFDWLQLHVNSKTRHTIDEIRLGTTWSSVTAAWSPAQ
jgi:hypothetical protein